MKKTLHIDEQLLREAKAAAGAKTDTDTVRLGLEALIRRAAYERLRALRAAQAHSRSRWLLPPQPNMIDVAILTCRISGAV